MLVGDDSTSNLKPAIIYVPGGGWGLRDPLPFTDVVTSTFTDPVSWAVQNPQSVTSAAENDYRLFVLNVASDANQSRAATGVSAGGNNPTGIGSSPPLAAAVSPTDTTLSIKRRNNLFPKGGYVKINSEVITYAGIDETVEPPQLTGLQRGVLGTSAASHSVDDTVAAVHWVEGDTYPAGTIIRGLYRARRTHVSEAGVNQPGDTISTTIATDYTSGDTTLALTDATNFDKASKIVVGALGLSATPTVQISNASDGTFEVESVAGFPTSGVLKITATGGAEEGLVEYAAYGSVVTTPGAQAFTSVTREITGDNTGRLDTTAVNNYTIESVGMEMLYSGVNGNNLTGLSVAPQDQGITDMLGLNVFADAGSLVSVPSDYFWENLGTTLDEATGVQRIPGRGEGSPAYAAQAALDVQTAISHIRKNAVELNVDPDKIVIYGSSAGGHAVAIAAYGPDMVRTSPVDPRSINAGQIGNGRPNAVMLDITPAFLNEYVTTNVGSTGLFLAFMRDAYGIKSQSLSFSAWQDYPEDFKKSLDGAALIQTTRKTLPTIFMGTGYKYSDRSPSQVQNGAAAATDWSALTQYNQYDTAKYEGKFWIAQRSNQSSTPGSNYDDWAQAGGAGALAPEVHHAYNGWRYMRELAAVGETQLCLFTTDDLDPDVRDVRAYTQVPSDPSDQGTVNTDYTVTTVSSVPTEALVDVGNAILAKLTSFLA